MLSGLLQREAASGTQRKLSCWLFAAALLFVGQVARADESAPKVTYDDQVAAVLKQRCGSCHNPTAKKADLDVTNYLKLMQGGASGASIESGDADGSYLFTLVTHSAEPHMPQNAEKLPDAEIDLLRRWINGGALEHSGSKVAKPKAKLALTPATSSVERPKVVPLPPRMVLEPAFDLAKAPMARSLAASPWAPLVAVASQRQVLLYDTKSLDLVGVLPFGEGQPNVVRFSRDGRLLLAGGGRPAASGKVVVWDVTKGERSFEVGNELDAVLAADISPDHKRIALGGPQRRVKVYSTQTGELLYELAKHTDWVVAVEFSPDGALLATADRNGGVCVWEADTGHEYLTLTGHTAAVNSVSWRGDSNVLATASEDTSVRLWEMENGANVKKWNSKGPILAMDFTRGGQVVTAGRDQVVRVWDQTGKQLTETKSLGDIVVSVAFCDESQRVIAANWAGIVQVFAAKDAAGVGSIATNPPRLESRLAAAREVLTQQTAIASPKIAASQQAELDLKKAQGELAAAKEKDAAQRAEAEKLTAEGSKLGQARAAAEAQKAKTEALVAQNEAAKPLVAEALKQVTEAIAKVPNDTKLTDVQRQLTEQQRVMEGGSADLKAKAAELAASMATMDEQLKQVRAKLESVGKESGGAAAEVKKLQSRVEELTKGRDSAAKAASAAESELTAAQKAVTRWESEIQFRDQMAVLRKELEAARGVASSSQAELDKVNQQLAAVKSAAEAAKGNAAKAALEADAVSAKIEALQRGK